MASDSQLSIFKRDINLIAYAAACGYALVRPESSRHSAVMKNAHGDKIVVARSASGHWIYFSVRDGADNGTIIDFVLHRKAGGNFGRVKRELSPWIGASVARDAPVQASFPDLLPSTRDRQQVVRAFAAMQSVARHPYLALRGLDLDTAGDPRFLGTVFADARGNAVFPHRDPDGLCGYETKNRGFTGFAPSGEKALWASNVREGDAALVIAESAVDAMSHFAMNRPFARYVSTAGAWNRRTPEHILAAVAALPDRAEVVLAFDNDDQGRKYADDAMHLLRDAKRTVRVDLPPTPGEDWNDHLRRERGIESPMPRHRPTIDRGRLK